MTVDISIKESIPSVGPDAYHEPDPVLNWNQMPGVECKRAHTKSGAINGDHRAAH